MPKSRWAIWSRRYGRRRPPVPIGVLIAVGIVAIFVAPRIGTYLRERPAADRDDVVQNFFLSVIIPQALRESVGLLGITVGLVTPARPLR